jgi:hypothetical protein
MIRGRLTGRLANREGNENRARAKEGRGRAMEKTARLLIQNHYTPHVFLVVNSEGQVDIYFSPLYALFPVA